MDRIAVVEHAKELMNEAVSWSVMKWMSEKKRVRKVADQANAALDEANRSIKAKWSNGIKSAYGSLNGSPSHSSNNGINGTILQAVKKMKQADDDAFRARIEAEQTFDLAEKRLSTALAREGCKKAILSWELHEAAILKAETLASLK